MVDINGTAPERADYTDSARSNKAWELVRRIKVIEMSQSLLYWIRHKKRDVALSMMRNKLLNASQVLATGSQSSENKYRTDGAKAIVDKFN
jgi:hypothetical protein